MITFLKNVERLLFLCLMLCSLLSLELQLANLADIKNSDLPTSLFLCTDIKTFYIRE